MTMDRRESKRVVNAGQVWFRKGYGSFRKASAVDLSTTGARIVLEEELKVGDRFDLGVKFGGHFMTVPAEAVWVTPLPGLTRRVAGVRILVENAGGQSYSRWLIEQAA